MKYLGVRVTTDRKEKDGKGVDQEESKLPELAPKKWGTQRGSQAHLLIS